MENTEMHVLSDADVSVVSGGYAGDDFCGTLYPGWWKGVVVGPIVIDPIIVSPIRGG